MTDTMDFISLIRPKRRDFLTTMTPAEQATMEQHKEYVNDMITQGKIFLDGGNADGSIGVLIYRVDSAKEARQLYYCDPAVIAGIGYPELYPLTIGHIASWTIFFKFFFIEVRDELVSRATHFPLGLFPAKNKVQGYEKGA
jgi:uncharacterized protein YciI